MSLSTDDLPESDEDDDDSSPAPVITQRRVLPPTVVAAPPAQPQPQPQQQQHRPAAGLLAPPQQASRTRAASDASQGSHASNDPLLPSSQDTSPALTLASLASSDRSRSPLSSQRAVAAKILRRRSLGAIDAVMQDASTDSDD